jgi:hypothetical protein
MQNVLIKYFESGTMKEFLGHEQYGNCARCKQYKELDGHHVRTRSRGGSKLIRVCRQCHQWIGEHIEEAIKLGLYEQGYGEFQPKQTKSNTD